jgi:hypothetical protein
METTKTQAYIQVNFTRKALKCCSHSFLLYWTFTSLQLHVASFQCVKPKDRPFDLCVRENVYSTHIPACSTLWATAVCLILSSITVRNIYLPAREPLDNTTVANLLTQLQTPSLLVSDSNLLWSLACDSDRSNNMERMTSLLGPVLCTYTCHLHMEHSHMEFALCSPELSLLFPWYLDGDTQSSD